MSEMMNQGTPWLLEFRAARSEGHSGQTRTCRPGTKSRTAPLWPTQMRSLPNNKQTMDGTWRQMIIQDSNRTSMAQLFLLEAVDEFQDQVLSIQLPRECLLGNTLASATAVTLAQEGRPSKQIRETADAEPARSSTTTT